MRRPAVERAALPAPWNLSTMSVIWELATQRPAARRIRRSRLVMRLCLLLALASAALAQGLLLGTTAYAGRVLRGARRLGALMDSARAEWPLAPSRRRAAAATVARPAPPPPRRAAIPAAPALVMPPPPHGVPAPP